MDRPVVTTILPEPARAIQGVDDPDPVAAEPPSVVGSVLDEDRFGGTKGSQLSQDERGRPTVALFTAKARVSPDEVLPHGNEECASSSRQVARERVVGENGRWEHVEPRNERRAVDGR